MFELWTKGGKGKGDNEVKKTITCHWFPIIFLSLGKSLHKLIHIHPEETNVTTLLMQDKICINIYAGQ